MFESPRPGVAILVSCVGRKLVMGGRVDDEVEAVANVFGTGASITGFYSNGEISPFVGSTECELHNQTMTITYLYE
jgi:small ligand-binding sensory domain FIST